MGRRITKPEFLEVVHDEVPKRFAETGFVLKRPAAYWRNVGAVEQGMFLYPDKDFTRIHVPTGAHVPVLDKYFDVIEGGHKCPGFHAPDLTHPIQRTHNSGR